MCCHKRLTGIRDFDLYFYMDALVCPDCLKNFKVHKKVYNVQGIELYVLYEYNEFLERLFFQYKEQRDIVLKDVFLWNHRYLKKYFKKYCVCTLCSSDEKRLKRGFEPAMDIFSCLNVPIYSPFYKKEDVKQSSQSKQGRSHIRDVLALKSLYSLPNKKILLVDDVCTTQNTLDAARALIHPDCMFVIAAHPLWIKANRENEVVKSKWFW